jgi:hypothetical protein
MMQLALENQLKTAKTWATVSWVAWSCVALLVAALMAPSAVKAQVAGTGEISGTVTDSSGAVVGGATVTATLVDQNTSTVRTTTGAGDYTITPLTPGTYSVLVTAKGFETYVQQNIVVDALATVPLNVKLTIGAAQQTITVTAAPPVLETTDATLGAVMDNQMYSSLPLLMGAGGSADQRRATDFAALMPGVQTNYTNSNNATDASGAVNGGNPIGGTSEIYIDGINLPEADGIGDPRFTWSAFGMDAIDQFQVQTSGIAAQYAGQGVQNYSIKQGSNSWHGGVYEYIRNTVLDAWKFTSKVPTVIGPVPAGQSCAFGSPASSYCAPGGVKPAEIMNEVGAKFGGPILHNKLFMFYNYGQYRNQNGPVGKLQTIPTLAMLGYSQSGTALGYADFTGFVAANPTYHIYDPSTQVFNCAGTAASPCIRTEFSNAGILDQIPGNRISAAAAYINKYMLPYEASAVQTGSTAYANNIVTGYPSGLANWYQGGRIDYDMSQKNQISIIVAFGRQASTGPNSSGATNQLGPPFNTNQAYTPKTTVDIVKDTFTINSHMVNVFAVAYGRYKSLSVTPNEMPQFAASQTGLAGTPTGQASFFPEIQFSGGSSSNDPTQEGGYDENQKVNNTYGAQDELQWQLGKHSLNFGAEAVEVQFNYIKNLTNSSPLNYTFSTSQTGAFADNSTNGASQSLNASTGSAVASYMIGAVNTSSVSVALPGFGSRWLDPSIWVQDDYKITPKLTMNLGVRWDIWPAIQEVHDLITWLNPSGVNSVTGNLGTLAFSGGAPNDGYHTGMHTPSSTFYGNVGPRIGLAYALDNKTVIRTSYTLNFARGDWTSGSQSGTPSSTGLAPNATAPTAVSSQPQFYWDNTACNVGAADNINCGWNGSVAPPSASLPAGAASLAEFATTNTSVTKTSNGSTQTYWDPHDGARTPEYLNWTFGVERQLTNNMSISVSYVGSEGHFLSASKAIGKRNNENPESLAALAGYTATGAPCTGTTCTASIITSVASAANLAEAATLGFPIPNPYTSATYYASNSVNQYYLPFPQFTGVSDTTSFVGNENWNALEVSLRQRPTRGFNFMINYTYSKSIDDLGTFRVGDNDRLDRSLSTADMPQNLVGTVVYQLPIGRGHMWGDNLFYRAIASDWTASGIFSDHSGFPIVVTGSGCGGAGILGQCMPSVVAGQAGRQLGAYGKNITSAPGSPRYIGGIQYLNPAAFTVNVNSSTASGQAINVGPGAALYAPGNAPRAAALNMWGMGYYDADVAIKRTIPIYREWNVGIELDMTNLTNHVVWASPSASVASGTNAGYGTITALSSANAPRDVQGSLRINF